MRFLLPLVVIVLSGCHGEFPVDDGARERARNAADIPVLRLALESIEEWHARNATGMADQLNPGASENDVIAAFESLGMRPTRELLTLWSWHDGETGEQPLIWYHDLLSAAEAADEYRSLLRHPLVRWDPRFVPVFSFEGEWYAVYCASDQEEAGPVVHYFLEDEPRISFTNLTTMMVSMAESFDSGAVSFDPETGSMVEDIQAVFRIHQQHNPGASFPYYVAGE